MTADASNPGGAAPTRLGELLVNEGLITEAQLEDALSCQSSGGRRLQLGALLVEQGLVTEDDVAATLARSIGTPFVHLTPELVQDDAIGTLPADYLEQHNLLPLSLVEGWLTVAVEQFTDVLLIEEIGRRAEARVQVIAAGASNIRAVRCAVLDRNVRGPRRAVGDVSGLDAILGEIGDDAIRVLEEQIDDADEDLLSTAAESPVVKLVNYIIQNAVESRASDIHIEPDDEAFRVRFRIDGDLAGSIRPSVRLLPAVVSRIKIMAGLDISERRLPQDGGMTVTLRDRAVDLRVSTMTSKYGEKVVMRIVDRSESILDLDVLGLPPHMLESLRETAHGPNGIVLVTGPTGSGKTTTLYGVLAELTSDKRNVSTIEDPVERRLKGANQFQVNVPAGFTFARALRSLLRQDPDVIMIGEIRDAETACLATEAAITGHLVLSTLHTNDAPTAVPRLVNMGVEPYLVAAALRAVLAQRLVRRLCPSCRAPRALTESESVVLARLFGPDHGVDRVFGSRGCGRCRETGYQGRMGVFELLTLNEEVLSIIARDEDLAALGRHLRERGYDTLLDDGIGKVRDGHIPLDRLLEIVSTTDEAARHERQAA